MTVVRTLVTPRLSRTSRREHWMSGHADTERTLMRKDWLSMPPPNTGIVTHDVHGETD